MNNQTAISVDILLEIDNNNWQFNFQIKQSKMLEPFKHKLSFRSQAVLKEYEELKWYLFNNSNLSSKKFTIIIVN